MHTEFSPWSASMATLEPSPDHEQVVFCRDHPTGLRAIIAIHNTTLGPGLGGARFFPYATETEALTDVLRLSEGMTYKAAAAQLPLGGAKAVIVGDPATLKSDELLRAYGRFVQSLGGRYYTAADVGTSATDLDVIGQASQYVVGRSTTAGSSGDSGYSTALGVFGAMQSAAELVWGTSGLTDRRVGVEGVGKVGGQLVDLLLQAGARVLVSDPNPASLQNLGVLQSQVQAVESVRDQVLDAYAPCAMGGSLTHQTAESISAQIICGSANNQLAEPTVAATLARRSILWVPDYVANAGGLIQVGAEVTDSDSATVIDRVRAIGDTAASILRDSLAQRITTSEAADQLVHQRLRAAASAAR